VVADGTPDAVGLETCVHEGTQVMAKVILSAVMITGKCRERAQEALDALCEQTIIDRMEIIVVDLSASTSKPFTYQPNARVVIMSKSPETSWAAARMAAVKKASADIVAFIEDHSFAYPDWAESVAEAFKGPWAAVGYGVVNANPQTYASRAGLVSDYILWMAPVIEGKARLLPGNNVAYRRELLEQFGDRLGFDLGVDFNIHEALRGQGHSLAMSGMALIAHQNFENIGGLLRANYHYCRLLAANRALSHNWKRWRRTLYSVAAPIGAPVVKLIRVAKSLRGRRSLIWPFLSSLPVMGLTFSVSAIGESLGYFLGAGHSAEDFNIWELMQPRTKNS
jgi:glycosyltransferase involved in cell wall biosynthesis